MQATPLQIGCKERSEPHARYTSSWARNNLTWLQEMLPGSHSLFLFDCNSHDAVLCGSCPETAQLSTAISAVVDSCRSHQHPAYVHQNTQTQSMAKQHSMLCIHLTLGKHKDAYRLVVVGNELNEAQRKTAIHLIQWASQRFELDDQATSVDSSKPAEPTTSPASQLSLSMLSALSQHGDSTALAFTLVNSLVRLCGCARVSLAHCDNGKLELLAMSGQASIDKRRDLARSLLALMRETVDAQAVLCPQPENAPDLPAHEHFHKEHGQHSIMSFCFAKTPIDQFVIVLERGKAQHFVPTQLQTIMAMVEAPGVLLQTQYQTQSSTTQKFMRAIRQGFVSWNRIGQWSAKRILWVSSVAALALLCVLPVKHRVSTTAFIDAADRQVLVAPEDGFILSAHARAGDFVEEGALLATLDTRELSLSADKWLSEKTKNDQAYAKALAVHDRIELSRLRADAQRIDAELNLVQQKLRRSEIRAPFNGVLLTGDWTQALGAPVGLGDVLFELASTEQYRLILEVDEHDVSYIQPGQMADLRMASLPGSSFKAELEAVMPVAVSEQGRSAFQITAAIDGGANKLQPGMQGVGKVLIGERSLLWVYTHKMVELVQYYAWKLGLL